MTDAVGCSEAVVKKSKSLKGNGSRVVNKNKAVD